MAGDAAKKDDWLERVLGVSVPKPKGGTKKVRFAAVTEQIPARGSAVQIGRGRPRSGAAIAPPALVRTQAFDAPGGKKLQVAELPNGRVKYTAPPPPVGEITFSGGGGKGTALPGAVKALHESGVLKTTKKIAGASVGSMTAALVAAGITPDEFLAVADADSTTDAITEGTGGTKKGLLWAAMKNKLTTWDGSPLTGEGLEGVVREVLDATLAKRIAEYQKECDAIGVPPDPTVVEVTRKLAGNKDGATFGDMRRLAQVIPAIKEVVMTGTYVEEFVENDKGKKKKLEGGNEEGQLYVFDADSEPDLPVAVAVHASASFPGAFKPVDIKLASGLTVRFIDGGVMNNTPTSSSLASQRQLDPLPQQRGISFVFDDEGEAEGMKKGRVDPAVGLGARVKDWFVGSDNAAGEYAKNKSLADRPEEIVVVPLRIELPPLPPVKVNTGLIEVEIPGQPRKIDMRGTMSGTLNFSPPMEARVGLRELTEKATNEQIDRESEDRTREFASASQMFVSIPLGELQTLVSGGYDQAAAALAFRNDVASTIAVLKKAASDALAGGGRAVDALQYAPANDALKALDRLAAADRDFQGYVGRELNKHADLDLLLEAARRLDRGKEQRSPTMKAADAVAEALRARTFADNILKQLVYPKMKQENAGGPGLLTLLTVEQLLRTAATVDDVNQAIDHAVAHFENKADHRVPRRGHKTFAKEIKRRHMSPAQ